MRRSILFTLILPLMIGVSIGTVIKHHRQKPVPAVQSTQAPYTPHSCTWM